MNPLNNVFFGLNWAIWIWIRFWCIWAWAVAEPDSIWFKTWTGSIWIKIDDNLIDANPHSFTLPTISSAAAVVAAIVFLAAGSADRSRAPSLSGKTIASKGFNLAPHLPKQPFSATFSSSPSHLRDGVGAVSGRLGKPHGIWSHSPFRLHPLFSVCSTSLFILLSVFSIWEFGCKRNFGFLRDWMVLDYNWDYCFYVSFCLCLRCDN